MMRGWVFFTTKDDDSRLRHFELMGSRHKREGPMGEKSYA